MIQAVWEKRNKNPDSSPVIKAGRGTTGTASAKLNKIRNTAKTFSRTPFLLSEWKGILTFIRAMKALRLSIIDAI